MESINKEDIRRAMGFGPERTITSVAMGGQNIMFNLSTANMLGITRIDYTEIINRNMVARKEIHFQYRDGAAIRRFLPQRWYGPHMIEGLDLDADDIRRFDLNYISSMNANPLTST